MIYHNRPRLRCASCLNLMLFEKSLTLPFRSRMCTLPPILLCTLLPMVCASNLVARFQRMCCGSTLAATLTRCDSA